MARAMRILHVVDSAGLYGKERVILELMAQQARAGLVPILGSIDRQTTAADKPIARAARAQGLAVTPLVVRGPGDPWRLRGVIADLGSDLVHTHDYKGSVVLAPLRRLGAIPPLVRTLHRVFVRGFSKLSAYETLDRWSLRWHDAIAAVTPAIQDEVPRQVTVIENGISPPRPAADPARPADPDLAVARAFCQDALVLGALARLAPEKNLGALLEAVAVLAQDGLPARLIVLGEGRTRPLLEAETRRLGIADRVWLPGFKADVRPWLGLFDLYVQPSWAEGLPIALLEAMQVGVPLLVTPIAGMNDLLARGAAIEIPFEGRALAEVVRRHGATAAGREHARRVAATARHLVATRYASDRMAAAYHALYRRLLSPRA